VCSSDLLHLSGVGHRDQFHRDRFIIHHHCAHVRYHVISQSRIQQRTPPPGTCARLGKGIKTIQGSSLCLIPLAAMHPLLLLGGAVVTLLVPVCDGHGYLWDPTGRASMWRRNWDTPTDYADNQCFCGGFQVSDSKKTKRKRKDLSG